ncbi:MAG TPA: metalloregulator ArsR/SmtB family transcription factor [Chitinophagaceae bacterium]
MKDQSPELSFDTIKLKKAALVLRALNHPLRQKILKTVHQKQSINVTDLYKTLKLEQSVASQHLGILRKAGFVMPNREGRVIHYSVNYERIDELNALVNEILLDGRKVD